MKPIITVSRVVAMEPIRLEGVKEYWDGCSVHLAMNASSNKLVFRSRVKTNIDWRNVDIDAISLIEWLETGGREVVEEANMRIKEGLSK
jgi:hypothetical protein